MVTIESDMDVEIDKVTVEAGKMVSVLTMSSDELIGTLIDINTNSSLDKQESEYKQMIIDELKARKMCRKL